MKNLLLIDETLKPRFSEIKVPKIGEIYHGTIEEQIGKFDRMRCIDLWNIYWFHPGSVHDNPVAKAFYGHTKYEYKPRVIAFMKTNHSGLHNEEIKGIRGTK